MRKLFIAGNWKMNLDLAGAKALAAAVKEIASTNPLVTIGVGPTFVQLQTVAAELAGTDVKVAGQNIHFQGNGAFTGETSAEMLLDAGAGHVILGHSERRHIFGENDQVINKKITRALEEGLDVIFCIGELLDEREAGTTNEVCERQLREGLKSIGAELMGRITVAYEPVWAIGTGKTASPEQAQEVHAFCRGILADMYGDDVAQATIIQYGGSVKPENTRRLMSCPDIDGALVGGAALKCESFAGIINEASAVSNR